MANDFSELRKAIKEIGLAEQEGYAVVIDGNVWLGSRLKVFNESKEKGAANAPAPSP